MKETVKVKNFNYLKGNEWIFELEGNEIYYILNEEGYKKYNLKNPINKQIIDSLLVGDSVEIDSIKLSGKNIVTKIYL